MGLSVIPNTILVYLIAFLKIFCLNGLNLLKSDLVVLMPEGGFGHTITGPDVIRRLFPDKRFTYIIFSSYKRHNKKVATIWPPNIKLIFTPLNFGLTVFSRKFASRSDLEIAFRLAKNVSFVLHKIFREKDIRFIEDVYRTLKLPQEFYTTTNKPRFCEWVVGYHSMLIDEDIKELHLPPKEKTLIHTFLKKALQINRCSHLNKLCCLYLREKGGELTSHTRSGSSLETYIPSIEFLNREGFQVLLTGDIKLPPIVAKRFKGAFLDATWIGINKNIFDLFAATEANIFIGEMGGGSWLPSINRIPSLLVNAFPIGQAMPFSLMYYKTVLGPDGQPPSFQKLFNDLIWDYELDGYKLLNNSQEEIYEAVTEFVTNHDQKCMVSFAGKMEKVKNHISKFTWLNHNNSQISPSYLRRNHFRIEIASTSTERVNHPHFSIKSEGEKSNQEETNDRVEHQIKTSPSL